MNDPLPASWPLFASRPRACPYLEGRTEQSIFGMLEGPNVTAMYESALHQGFRRSQAFVYRTACPGCDSCRSLRVRATDFKPSRSQKRVLKKNRDLIETVSAPQATAEGFALFTRYQYARHSGGGMDAMAYADYRDMVESSPIPTQAISYRNADGDLQAVMLADRLSDGYSAVYSFFDPDRHERSLGTFMVLSLIEVCRRIGMPYLYLGYWVAGSAKMDYKIHFQPAEILTSAGWQAVARPASVKAGRA